MVNWFGRLLGVEEKETVTELVEAQVPDSFGEGFSIASKFTPSRVRVDRNELELAYIHDPVIFGGINRVTQTIMSTPRELSGGKEKYRKFIEKFMRNIGNSGNNNTEEEFLSRLFFSECVFGPGFIQFIYNRRGNLIVDIGIVDAKTMDYAKDGSGNIVMDQYGRPIGYTQKFPLMETIPERLSKFRKVPEGSEVSLYDNEIFIPATRIAMTKLFTVGDEFYPLGIVESIYKRSVRKLNMEEALANTVYTMGFPIKKCEVGDEKHKPTPGELNNVLEKLKKLDYKTSIALPYWQKLDLLQPSRIESLDKQFGYFINMQASGMGVPLAYITGSGEGIDKNTAVFVDNLFTATVADIINRTIRDISKNIFKKILEVEFSNGNKTFKIDLNDVPYYKFDIPGIGALDKQADRLRKLEKAGVLPEDKSKISEKVVRKEGLD